METTPLVDVHAHRSQLPNEVKSKDEDPERSLLNVQNLTIALPKGSDRPYAVEKLSFGLKAGEILCVVGESGSGKSISANAIMGLLPPTLKRQSGRILFKQQDLLQQSEKAWQRLRGKEIAMIFQEPMSALNPIMSVGNQITEVMVAHQIYTATDRRRRVLELLGFVGLPEPETVQHAYPVHLSGGQCQRVVIAMALALEPTILIADEPTTALDVTTQAQILALIKRIQQSMGMSVLFITHDLSVVAHIADRIIVMEQGQLREQGPTMEVLHRPQHAYTRRLIAAVSCDYEKNELTPAQLETPILIAQNLRKTYVTGRRGFYQKRIVSAVNNVSFTLSRGQTLGVVGESGSGKSTLSKGLLKLIEMDSGQLLFKGQDILPLSQAAFRAYRKQIQMVFQDPFASLNPRHTVGRILTDGPRVNGIAYETAVHKAHQLLRWVGLDASAFNRYPHEFSGGQRQRISVARALILEPTVLVADESLSALDVSVQAQILDLLQKLQKQFGIAMVFITHDLQVAAKICHHVAVMHQGSIVEQGRATQVLKQPQHPYTQRLVAAAPSLLWSEISYVD